MACWASQTVPTPPSHNTGSGSAQSLHNASRLAKASRLPLLLILPAFEEEEVDTGEGRGREFRTWVLVSGELAPVSGEQGQGESGERQGRRGLSVRGGRKKERGGD